MSLFAGGIGGGHGASWFDSDRLAATLTAPHVRPPRQWHGTEAVLLHAQSCTKPEDPQERQPLIGADGQAVLLYDGRLDNRDELAGDLGLPPRQPDGAVVRAALERWGDEAVARLLGPFALAWYQIGQRRLVLARDAVGLRSLYYLDGQDGLAFATLPRSLLALPGRHHQVDEASIACFLADLPPEPGTSFHVGMRQVPAASLAVWRPGRPVSLHRYWQPDFTRRLHLRHDDDYVEAAQEHLTTAVRACLRADRPVASQLSGGLDSSLVATTAAALLAPAPLTTLTTVPAEGAAVPRFPNRFTDEGALALATAALHANIHPQVVAATPTTLLERQPARVFIPAGEPLRGISNIGWFSDSFDWARAHGHRVILTGGGGNLTLTWDGMPGLSDLFDSGRWLRLYRELRPLARQRGLSSARLAWRTLLRPRLPEALTGRLGQALGRPDWSAGCALHPDLVAAMDIARRRQAYERAVAGSGSAAMRRLWLEVTQHIAGKGALLEAVRGLELRSPLFDRRLLEFCFALPNDQYLRHGVTRRLARRLLAGRAPPEVVNNPARGLQGADFLHRLTLRRDELRGTLDELERSPLASRCLDLPRLRRLLEDMPAEARAEHMVPYVAALGRGLHAGQFLRWAEGGNA